MKKFIMCCPLQPEGKLDKIQYASSGDEKLKLDKPTRFPVIPLINGYAEDGEKVEIILIRSEYENTKLNEEYLRQEAGELEKEKNIEITIVPVDTPYNETISTELDLFVDIIGHINDGDMLFACATYGTKPTPIIEIMAVNYGYRALNNVSIGAIVYGQRDFNKPGMGELFDITALFYMDEMVNKLAQAKTKNPGDVIKRIMNI